MPCCKREGDFNAVSRLEGKGGTGLVDDAVSGDVVRGDGGADLRERKLLALRDGVR